MPSQTSIAEKPTRGKGDARMALIKWARSEGAVHIKVDGIEIVFPPEGTPPARGAAVAAPVSVRALSPSGGPSGPEDSRPGSVYERLQAEAKRAAEPNEFSQASDTWQNFQPLPR